MSTAFKPLTKAVTTKLVARTLAELKADLAEAAQRAPISQERGRIGALEIALARVVGAVAGQQAEDELTTLLGWDQNSGVDGEDLGWNFGKNARSIAEHDARLYSADGRTS